ncbi:MAG: DMT family transporter [Gammaproteobacteria bacterium]|nr:DMT family transporter [Gammaproteobacteria bacterium]
MGHDQPGQCALESRLSGRGRVRAVLGRTVPQRPAHGVSSWVPLEPWSLAIFLGVGAAGATLHFSVIMAYRLAQAATVAPVEYAAVLWASLFGALFFGEVPNGPMIAGAGLIITAGLIVLRARE